MKSELTTLARIYGVRRFPPGRLFTVLLAMRQVAADAGLGELVDRLEGGVALVKRYVDLRRLRQHRRLGRGGGQAKKIDRVIDDDIAEIAHIAGKEAERFPETRSGKAAQDLLDAFFVNGVAPITQIPYDEELAVVENMVPLIREKHADAVALLGLGRLVARIEAHLPLYRDALAPDDGVSSAELVAAYEAMQVALLKALGWVTVMVDDLDLRARLVAPMLEHDAQLAAHYAARRRGGTGGAEDVDPADLDLDAEAREGSDEAAAADAAAEAQADADAAGDGPEADAASPGPA
ncbi:MAG: hypothetical protein R3F65_33650 [bacterium]